MKRSVAFGSAALVAALLFLAWSTRDGAPSPAKPAGLSVKAETRLSRPAIEPQVAPAPVIPARPGDVHASDLARLRQRVAQSSLRGTTPDGEIAFTASGALRMDAALVRRFEHYLSLIGEFELGEIRVLLQADLRDELGTAAADVVIAGFDRYVALREAVAASELSDDLATRLQQLRELRRDYFGADAEAMFGAEEADLAHGLARRAIESDAALDPEQRRARLEDLENRRAPSLREAQRDATSALLVDEQTRQFDRDGVDPATRAEERRDLWGDAAADRLATLDAERAHWQTRLASYARERERVLADPRLGQAARQQALEDLRHRAFNPQERLRVEALEAVGALPPSG